MLNCHVKQAAKQDILTDHSKMSSYQIFHEGGCSSCCHSTICNIFRCCYFKAVENFFKHTNFHKISPKETREKWGHAVFLVCMFVTSYNFEMNVHACASIAFWRHLARLRGRRIVFKNFKPLSIREHCDTFLEMKFRIRNSYPMDRMYTILHLSNDGC